MNIRVNPFERELTGYKFWLKEQGIAEATQRAYGSRVRQFLSHLEGEHKTLEEIKEERGFLKAIFDYCMYLKETVKMRAGTLNNSLTAAESFAKYLGFSNLNLTALRESTDMSLGRTLSSEETSRFLEAVERRYSLRDKAIAMLFLSTGIKLGECHLLNIEDVVLGAQANILIVRGGQKKAARELVLNEETGSVISTWLAQRCQCAGAEKEKALFLNARGDRLAQAGIDFIVRSIGWSANLNLSCQMLRRTFLVRHLQQGQAAEQLAELVGHKTLQATRRYCVGYVME
jgi:site-specific recombinase XerD